MSRRLEIETNDQNRPLRTPTIVYRVIHPDFERDNQGGPSRVSPSLVFFPLTRFLNAAVFYFPFDFMDQDERR